jgi:hypothetical protein
VGCGSEPVGGSSSSPQDADSGSVGFALTLPGGAVLSSVSYTVIGPANYSKTGTVDVSNSTTISALIPLPAGGPYSITLSGTSTDNRVNCSGSGQISITAGQTQTLAIAMTCREAARTGSVAINGSLNSCPVIDSLGASPAEVLVGGTITLSSEAHDSDASPSALSYKWTASSGSLSSATAANPTFKCTEPGTASITLSVSDGDTTPDCPATQTTTVTCTRGPNDFSFVVVGCNRVDPTVVTPAMAPDSFPSTANAPQLKRTFAEVAAMNPLPDYFFFAGDLVMGYTNDNAALRAELQGWVDLYKASPLYGTSVKLVAIPGNHETQNASKVTTLAAEQAWLEIMAPYIIGSNGAPAGGADGLATDQSKLSYSFDWKGTHFLLLDTDPQARDWTVPTQWVAADVAAARAAGAKHILAITHKPAYGWSGAPTDSLLGKGAQPTSFYLNLRDQFWSTLESNQAEALFSAHNHLWTKFQPTNRTWQIIAGNGGSPLEATVADGSAGIPAYYGYTVVNVSAAGPVTVKSMGRNVPAEGYWAAAPAATYPTTVRDTQDITWR